jgi:hypothetical protein
MHTRHGMDGRLGGCLVSLVDRMQTRTVRQMTKIQKTSARSVGSAGCCLWTWTDGHVRLMSCGAPLMLIGQCVCLDYWCSVALCCHALGDEEIMLLERVVWETEEIM